MTPLQNPVAFPVAIPVSENTPPPSSPTTPKDFSLNHHPLKSMNTRVITVFEESLKPATTQFRKKIVAVYALICVSSLLIPGVNVALFTTMFLVAALVAVLITCVMGAIAAKLDTATPIKEKAKILFVECLKSALAPVGCLHDLYLARVQNAKHHYQILPPPGYESIDP